MIFFVYYQGKFNKMSDFQEIFYIAVGILSAITIHECAHAWVADKLGDDTAKMEGRVT